MTTGLRCAWVSSAFGEPLFASASTVRRWLLVEQPGAWGRDALLQSGVPTPVAARLAAAAQAAGVRVVVIRSPGRIAPTARRCIAVWSGPGNPWMRSAAVTDPAELLEVDLATLFAGGGGHGFGEPLAGPLHLVCTHGRHDPCCADLGRPLVRALASTTTDVWESSHIGGDRFAGNLLCFPHGLYFGRVSPEEGPRIVDAYRKGRIELDRFRGRSCYDFVTQAADYLVRSERGLVGIDDLVPVARRGLGDGRHLVELAGAEGQRYAAILRVTYADEDRQTTCKAAGTSQPRQYELIALEQG